MFVRTTRRSSVIPMCCSEKTSCILTQISDGRCMKKLTHHKNAKISAHHTNPFPTSLATNKATHFIQNITFDLQGTAQPSTILHHRPHYSLYPYTPSHSFSQPNYISNTANRISYDG